MNEKWLEKYSTLVQLLNMHTYGFYSLRPPVSYLLSSPTNPVRNQHHVQLGPVRPLHLLPQVIASRTLYVRTIKILPMPTQKLSLPRNTLSFSVYVLVPTVVIATRDMVSMQLI